MIVIQQGKCDLVPLSKVIFWLEKLAEVHSFDIGKLVYYFVDDEEITRINREHLNHDYITDIITFDYSSKSRIKGEIYISCPQIIRQAGDYNQSVQSEMLRVMAHGLLHMMGFNDKLPQEQLVMKIEEDKALLLHAQICKGAGV